MSENPTVEAVGDHNYVLHLQAADGDAVEVTIYASPDVIAALTGTIDADEGKVVEATLAYLLARQGVDDLPAFLELDDVAGAYQGYVEDLRGQLGPSSRPGPDR
ncbi:hypothetical protein G7075_14435 [Phycicoccus sp. HDW14]|nr:hypothetical protein G7075_14435 [Phycicoccus sp. HDW14]